MVVLTNGVGVFTLSARIYNGIHSCMLKESGEHLFYTYNLFYIGYTGVYNPLNFCKNVKKL